MKNILIGKRYWKEFLPEDDSFRILFPTYPEHSEMIITHEQRKEKIMAGTIFGYITRDKWHDCHLSGGYLCFRLIKEIFADALSNRIDEIIEKKKWVSLYTTHAEDIVKKDPFLFNNQYPVREFEILNGRIDLMHKIRFLCFGNVLYTFTVDGRKMDCFEEDYQTFVTSFTLK